ncbi:NlpC/P60 family protein [Streptomyces sp. NPDC001652]|uniref:NlpC/P60 family protein n=1 Tax=Streptomyces sp. NPDC001652 TaxID=3154393 RepID=UPI00332901EA
MRRSWGAGRAGWGERPWGRRVRLLLAALVTVVSLGLPVASAAPAAAATGCAPLQAGASQAAQAAVQVACRYVGRQYAWGGGHAQGMPGPSQGIYDEWYPETAADPTYWSFDCIGLVRWAWYKATGRDLITERTTQATFAAPGYAHTKLLKSQGSAALLPGDIMYFGPEGAGPTHVALYLGNGLMVEAPESGMKIQVNSISARWDRYKGAFRPHAEAVPVVWNWEGRGSFHKTWGQPNLRQDSNTGSPINFTNGNGISVEVRVLCQRVGERATVDGMVNNVWSYLPDYNSWISNLFVQGPALLKDVPSCGDFPPIGGTLAGAENNTSCGDGTQPDSAGAWTAKSTTVFGRTVELRYNGTTECAWGRITGGTVGDEIWVDRSADGGNTWQPMLGYTVVTSGNDAYTTQWNDSGLLMRACGTNGRGGSIECTGWF